MASVNATMGKSTSSTTEVTDDEVCLCGILFSKLLNNSQFALHQVAKQWLVSLQRMQCNWCSQTSTFRGLNTMIQRYQVPTSTKASDVQVKYGIAVEVANSTGIGEVRICNT